jgi:hypothetical protein
VGDENIFTGKKEGEFLLTPVKKGVNFMTMKNKKSVYWILLAVGFMPLLCFGLFCFDSTNIVETPLAAPSNLYDIPVWFLVMGLFLPRLTLFIAWIGHCIPPNDIPFIGDLFLTLLVPRVLIMIYIVGCMGLYCGWFWVHLIVLILISAKRVLTRTKKRVK